MNKVECRIEPQPPQEGETRTIEQVWAPLPSNSLDAQALVRWGWVTINGQDPARRVVLSMPYEVAKELRGFTLYRLAYQDGLSAEGRTSLLLVAGALKDAGL